MEEVLILAATADGKDLSFNTAAPLCDTLKRRPFDYKLSPSEYADARPSIPEQVAQKFVDRRKSITVNTPFINGTFQLADAYSIVRSLFRLK